MTETPVLIKAFLIILCVILVFLTLELTDSE